MSSKVRMVKQKTAPNKSRPVTRRSGEALHPRGSREGLRGSRDTMEEEGGQMDDSPRDLDRHADNLLNGFEVMWRQNVMCDVTLVIQSTCFRAHRGVLASCSDYFYHLFTGGHEQSAGVEVVMDGIETDSMAALLECMYTGKVEISEENVRELLQGASKVKFYAVEEACGDYLRERLNTGNCLRMLALADTYHLSDLVYAALCTASLNFPEVSEGFDFLQLDVDQLITLLIRDDLHVENELVVFKKVLLWVEHDKSARMLHAAELLKNLRLPLLTPSQIVDQVETVDYLMDLPECEKLVNEALRYHCLPARQSILQTPRTTPRSVERREVLVAAGGAPRLVTDPVSDVVNYYDPERDTWGVLTRMHEPRHHHAAAVLGGFLYVAGGERTNDQRSPLSTVWRFDPRTDSWLQVASMKNRRESFQLAVLNGSLYAVGGRVDRNTSLAEVERYSPAVDQWEGVAPLSSPRRAVAVCGHNGRLYAMGGSGSHRISSRVERYNPLTNQWETRRSLSIPRFFAHLTSAGSKLFLFGGATIDPNGNVACVRKVDCYHPNTDTWSSISMLNEPRAEAGGAILTGKLYIIGGYSWDRELRLTSAEVYDIERNSWSEARGIDHPLTGIACAPLTIYRTPPPEPPGAEEGYTPRLLASDPVSEASTAGETRSAADTSRAGLHGAEAHELQPETQPRQVHSVL